MLGKRVIHLISQAERVTDNGGVLRSVLDLLREKEFSLETFAKTQKGVAAE